MRFLDREFNLKWLIITPIIGIMLIGVAAQEMMVKEGVSAAKTTFAVTKKTDAIKSINAEYKANFDNNSALTQIILESSGLKQYLADNDAQQVQAKLNDIFITDFALQNFTEISIFNLQNKYMAGSSLTNSLLLNNDFNRELTEVGRTKAPYYTVRCDAKNTCTGYSILPLMYQGKDVGYAIAGFQAVFLQYINNNKISVTRLSKSTLKHQNRIEIQPSSIHFPSDAWLIVDIGEDENVSIIKKLENSLLISNLIEGSIIGLLIYALLSYRAKDIVELARMVTSLTTGDKNGFTNLRNMRSSRKMKITEVTQLEKSIFLLAQKQEDVINEQTRRKAAEFIASEKRNSLNQATREFESVRQRLASSLHNEQFQRIVFSMDTCNNAIENDDKKDIAHSDEFHYINKMLTQMKSHILDVVNELYPTAIAHGIYHALDMEITEAKIKYKDTCIFSWAIEECVNDTAPIIQRILYLTVKEAIENAIRHAEPKTIDILIWCENEIVNGTITNDGNGDDYSVITRSGEGLAEMESLITRINGSFIVQSSKQTGTVINFAIPL